MALANEKALPRKTQVFVRKESSPGSFVMPAGTDVIRVYEMPTPAQSARFTDLDELADSRSRQGRTFDGFDPASFNLAMNLRLPGTAGQKPPGSDLLECAFGACTVGASDVTYSPAISLPSFSAVISLDHTAYYVSGGRVNTLKPSFKRGGSVSLSFECLAIKAPQAGTSETVSGSSGDTVNLVAGGAEYFAPGAYVKLGSDDNSGAGYLVAAVNSTNHTITLSPSPATAPDADVVVAPFIPTASYSGIVVEGATGRVSLDGADLTVTAADLSLANNIEADTEELTGEPYPSDIREGQRVVSATLAARFRRNLTPYFTRAHQRISGVLELNGGEETGGRFKFTLGHAEFDTPAVSADGRQTNVSLSVQAFPTAANEDELTLVIY